MEVEIWVHCESHGRPHRLNEDLVSCWCGCIDDIPDIGRLGTLLGATSEKEAFAECGERGLWLYADFEKGISKKEQEKRGKKIKIGNIQMPIIRPKKNEV